MSLARMELYFGSDNTLTVRNLKRESTGVLVDDADVVDVTARVLDSSGAAVSGIPDPITFSAVSGVTGAWNGTISDTGPGWSVGDKGRVDYTATLTDGSVRLRSRDYIVVRK